jgi:predicted O-linked N-acetylglucosamine transferase (SPINDLY family)
VRINPAYWEAHSNLGNALIVQGKHDQAVASYQRVLQLRPQDADTYAKLGNVLHEQGRFDQALASYRRALQLDPRNAGVHYNLGIRLHAQGHLDQAIASYERALQINPQSTSALSNLVHQRQHVCCWRDLDDLSARVIDAVDGELDGGTLIAPFFFFVLPTTAKQQLRCAQQWAQHRFAHLIAAAADTGFRFSPAERNKIRVAYLSAKFNQHASATLIAEVIEQHDRDRFEVVGYSCGPDDGSPLGERLRKAFDRCEDVRADSFQAAAQRIHADGIDILVDLTGYDSFSAVSTTVTRSRRRCLTSGCVS